MENEEVISVEDSEESVEEEFDSDDEIPEPYNQVVGDNMEVEQPNMAENEANIFTDSTTIAEERKKLGNEHYKAQNYQEALKLYSDAISLCPDSAQYYSNRAACYMMQGKYAQALIDARQAVRLDAEFHKAYVRIAKCCLALGDLVGTELAIKKCHELSPQNSGVSSEKTSLGRLRDIDSKSTSEYEKKAYRSVVYYMDNALKIAPACVRYRLMKGECLAFLGRYDEALELALSVMKVDATSAEAIYLRGLCLYFTDNLEKATQHFQHALQLDPDHVRAKEMRSKSKTLKELKEEGNVKYNSHCLKEAYAIYTDALKIDPLNAEINSKLYYNRALVCSKISKLKDAIADCTKVLEINSEYLKAIVLRARCYSDLEMYKECVADYEMAYQKNKTPDLKRMLTNAKFELKKSLRTDYYKILGVPKSSSSEQIKKAYRQKAKEHHPDRHANINKEELKNEEIKFKQVSEAYNVLIDPEKRARYDAGPDVDDDFNQMRRNANYYYYNYEFQ